MLGPFDQPLFVPWCQVKQLITRPKKDNRNHHVIMSLSWPHPPDLSLNGGTTKDTYLGLAKEMHLPSAQDLADRIRQAGTGAYVYSCNITRAYHQLPLAPAHWLLMCFKMEGQYFLDIILPFGH